MRQVGDRLIPVGVTSGRLHAISPEESGQSDNGENGGSRRSRRQRAQNQDLGHLLGSMGLGGQDLEEVSHIVELLTFYILNSTSSCSL